MGRVLDALEHRVRLPPRDVVVVVEVGEVIDRVGGVRHAGVANVARLFWSFGAGLRAKLARSVHAARVGRLHWQVERRVHKVRDAPLQNSTNNSERAAQYFHFILKYS